MPDRVLPRLIILHFPYIEDNKDQEQTYKGLVSLGNKVKMDHESWIKDMNKRNYRLVKYEKLNINPATITKQFTGEQVRELCL